MSAASSLELVSNLDPIDYTEEDFKATSLRNGEPDDDHALLVAIPPEVNKSRPVERIDTFSVTSLPSVPLTNSANPTTKPVQPDPIYSSLRKKFADIYGQENDPSTVLKIIGRDNSVAEDNFWTCFSLVYPRTAPGIAELRQELENLSHTLHESGNWWWPFDSFDLSEPFRDLNGQYGKWKYNKDKIQKILSDIEKCWVLLKPEVVAIKTPIKRAFFNDMPAAIDNLVEYLQEKVEDTITRETKAEEEARIAAEEEPDAILPPQMESAPSPYQHMYNPYPPTTKPIFYRRLLLCMGGQYARLCTVSFLGLAGLVLTGLAAWMCAPQDATPMIDSNFWSTQSSALLGFGGLYCTIIPKLQQQKIEVGPPLMLKIFWVLLNLSAITALTAAVCYPYQTQASLVLISISGEAQLAITLLFVEGSVMKIKRQMSEIADLKVQKRELEGERRRGLWGRRRA